MTFKYDVFTFDVPNKLMLVDSGVTEVTCQQTYDAAKLFEAEPANLYLLPVCKASGKEFLRQDGSKKVGITLTMLNDWRVQFPAATGPTVEIRQITDGNFLAINQYQNVPIAASAYISVIIAQDSSPTIVESGVSGLTAQESTQLSIIDTLRKIHTNKFITDPTTGQLTIFDDDGVSVLYQGNIWEDAAAATAYRGRCLERRDALS